MYKEGVILLFIAIILIVLTCVCCYLFIPQTEYYVITTDLKVNETVCADYTVDNENCYIKTYEVAQKFSLNKVGRIQIIKFDEWYNIDCVKSSPFQRWLADR